MQTETSKTVELGDIIVAAFDRASRRARSSKRRKRSSRFQSNAQP
jgi:hypothetical protein